MYRGDYVFYGDVDQVLRADQCVEIDVHMVDAVVRDILKAGGVTDLSEANKRACVVVRLGADTVVEEFVSTFVKGLNKLFLVESVSVKRTDVVCRLVKEL